MPRQYSSCLTAQNFPITTGKPLARRYVPDLLINFNIVRYKLWLTPVTRHFTLTPTRLFGAAPMQRQSDGAPCLAHAQISPVLPPPHHALHALAILLALQPFMPDSQPTSPGIGRAALVPSIGQAMPRCGTMSSGVNRDLRPRGHGIFTQEWRSAV